VEALLAFCVAVELVMSQMGGGIEILRSGNELHELVDTFGC
jgi:hypothetical protein